MGKYFGQKKSNINDMERMATTIKKYFSEDMVLLVNIYISQYEKYYGEKCPNSYYNIANKIKEFCKRHCLNYKDNNDRDWFIDNVLDIIFKKYDELGYSSARFPRFSPAHLTTDWLIANIIDNKPAYK